MHPQLDFKCPPFPQQPSALWSSSMRRLQRNAEQLVYNTLWLGTLARRPRYTRIKDERLTSTRSTSLDGWMFLDVLRFLTIEGVPPSVQFILFSFPSLHPCYTMYRPAPVYDASSRKPPKKQKTKSLKSITMLLKRVTYNKSSLSARLRLIHCLFGPQFPVLLAGK